MAGCNKQRKYVVMIIWLDLTETNTKQLQQKREEVYISNGYNTPATGNVNDKKLFILNQRQTT